MAEQLNEGNLNLLTDIGKALRYAEREDAKTRHGSTADEYHRARLLGEAFCSGVAKTSVEAVRDLPDNQGISLLIQYHGKNRLIAMTFVELQQAKNDPEDNVALFAAWYKVLKSPASVVAPTRIVQGTARKTAKKAAAAK